MRFGMIKKLIIGWVAFKLLLLALFWSLAFSGCNPLGVSSAEVSPTPTPTPDDSITRETSNPYTGELSRFDREDRAEKLQIQKVMDLLRIENGSRVADIGAGSGWFTMIASDRVGKDGMVYAVDISENSIRFIDERIENENRTNIETVLGKPDDPLLQRKNISAVLILNTYHEISSPVKFLRNLRKSLKKDALVGIIDRDGSGDDHGIDSAIVVKEAERAGFALKEKHDFVKADRMDYFIILTPQADD